MTKKLFVLIIFSIALRLISLNQSLWLDEAISAQVTKNYSYSEIITDFSPSDFHPPLYYLTLKAWTTLFGYSEVVLRLPSVIFSLITILLVYKFFGFWPSLLLSLNPLYLYYSQEARMYSLITLLIYSAFLSFKNKNVILYFIFTFLSLSTFYGSIFFFVAISFYFLFKKQYKNFFVYSLAIVIPLLFWSELLLAQYQNSINLRQLVVNWSTVLGPANLKNLLLIPIKFTLGRISFYPKIFYYLTAVVFTVPLWFLLFFRSFKHRQIAFIFWATFIIGFIFSLFTPMFQYFRFLYLLPFLCLLINKNRFYLFVFLFFSSLYLFIPAFHREDWQTLANSLSRSVYMIPSAADPVNYYRSDITITDISSSPTENIITVIPYLSAIHGFDYQSKLLADGYSLEKTSNFRQLTTETWIKNP